MRIGTTQTIGNFTVQRVSKTEIVVRHTSLYLGGCLLKVNMLNPGEIQGSVFTSKKRGGEPVYKGCDGKAAMSVLMQWLREMEAEVVGE